jgi:hypothetical protein
MGQTGMATRAKELGSRVSVDKGIVSTYSCSRHGAGDQSGEQSSPF